MGCELSRCFPDQEVLEWVKWVVSWCVVFLIRKYWNGLSGL